MKNDPIITEIWRAKEEFARQFDFDIRAMGRYLQEQQGADGREVVSRSPRRIENEGPRKAS